MSDGPFPSSIKDTDIMSTDKGAFAGRIVIVTGGAGSIGKPLCLALAREGAKVVVNDLGGSVTGDGASNGPASNVVKELHEQGFQNVVADFHDVREGDKIVQTAIDKFGGIDIIINNAGIQAYGASEDFSMEFFTKSMEINVLGPIAIMKAAWPHFESQKYGRVVNFASDTIFGIDICAPYEISKSALFGATKAFANEGRPHNILVNAVAPQSLSRMTESAIKDEAIAAIFKKLYTGERNIIPVLALAHESNTINGQMFLTGADKVAKFELGIRELAHDVTTTEQFFAAMNDQKQANSTIYVPANSYEFMAWKAKHS